MFLKRLHLFVLTFFVVLIAVSEPARILSLFPTWSRSHLIIEMSVIKTLVNRGHNITVITTLPLKEIIPQFRHIQLPERKVPKDMFPGIIDETSGFKMLANLKAMIDFSINSSISVLEDPKMKKLMQEEEYDLVIMGFFLNYFHIGIPAHFKCPWIIVDTHLPSQVISEWIGNPLEKLYVPNGMSSAVQPLNFFDRLLNIVLCFLEYTLNELLLVRFKNIYSQYFLPDKYPSYEDAARNVSLVLHVSHFSEGPIRPVVPGFIQIGGIQVNPTPNRLPQDIQHILDSAKDHGAILFSLGSNAKSSALQPEIIRIFFNVFSSLKQKVIWKWEDDQLPGNSSNILFKKWLPQDDILAHSNTKLFVSHCGLGSAIEAKYRGVPIIGMPLFGDQFAIAKTMKNSEFGIVVDYRSLTEDIFRSAVTEVLDNRKYREKVQEFSKLYRDRPINARETAAYWIEYVIRHRGAKHLQSPAVHMNTIQYYGIDVIAFLCIACYIIFKAVATLFKIILRKVCKRKSEKIKRD